MTSLAEQLKQLAIPHSLQQKDRKKKPSLLFDENEAAGLDRDTIFDIGLDGLKELIRTDPVFVQFSNNLFNISSRYFERTTQSKDVNKKLDENIGKFLKLLSPYVLLKPAHRALEWLICRYHIQDFNTDDLMGLVLPYHETKIFAKVLQLINLNLPTSKNFSWLNTIQKQGVHLPKLILINHLISDSSFLRFICDTFVKTLEEHNNNNKSVEKLGTLINFYCFTLVNMLSRKDVNNHLITVLLPSLVTALSYKSLNVQASALMICGQLVAAHQVSQTLLQEILKQIINDIDSETSNLQKEKVLLLTLIFQKQESASLSSKWKKKLMSLKKILSQLEENGICVEPLVKNLKKIGLEKVYGDKDDVNQNSGTLETPVSDVAIEMQYLKELEDCSGDKRESAWLKLRPRLIEKVNNYEIYKGLCKVAPSYDKLVLLICLDKLLKKGSKQNQSTVLKKMLKSNFGSTNPYLQEISENLESDKSIQDILELYVLKQNKEYENPVEFEPWLAALKELKMYNQFSENYTIWELGLKILVASLATEYNPTQALQILNFLKSLKRRKIKTSFTLLNSLIDYIHDHGNKPCEWYDVSSKNPDIWLKVRLLDYILGGMYEETDLKDSYSVAMDKFSKSAFASKENFISFISAVCGGTPFENSEYKISPYLQLYSIHIAWLQFKMNDASVLKFFYPEKNRALCYILICLSNPWPPIRKATFEVIEVLVKVFEQHEDKNEALFYEQLLSRSQEVLSDNEQVSVALYYLLSPSKLVMATLDSKLQRATFQIRNHLFNIASAETTPLYISAKILSLLEAVNSKEILMDLKSLCSRSLTVCKDSVSARIILSKFWSRLNEDTAEALENSEIWNLAIQSIKHPKCDDLNPAVSFLKAVTKELFELLSQNKKYELLELLISVRSESDCSEISSAIASAIKKINIDSVIILPLIEKMITVLKSSQKNRDERKSITANIIESKDWKTGVSLLELIQSKKKLQNANKLLKPLFDVLQFCFTQEEQTAFEYAKQLVLGCLLHCCQKLTNESQTVDSSSLNADLVVQCLRASPNPQTHHHALLLLSCLAAIVPDQVMHNIMAIFTFMGTSVTRLDDEHSVKIVTQVVDTVVPVLMRSMHSLKDPIETVMAKILVVFVWALKDIPQHRRKPLFLQLLTTLHPDKSLWILLLLLIENSVLQGNFVKAEGLPPDLLLGLQLTLAMTPQIILESVVRLVRYIYTLPCEKLMNEKKPSNPPPANAECNLFNTAIKTTKQLRQFVYNILTFINNLLSNNNLIVQITEEKDEKSLESAFEKAMASLLTYIQVAIRCYGLEHDKFWKAVIHQCYEILDKFVSLVPSQMLLSVIKDLLDPKMGPLRKKALDLLNVLLQNHKVDFTDKEKKVLSKLLNSVLEVIGDIGQTSEQEHEILQQTALITLKLLTKLLCSENLTLFKQILAQLCGIAKEKKCEGHLLGSVMVAISDQVTYLKVHSVSQLPVFLPLMLKIFSDNMEEDKMSDLALISITTALHKVVDVLPHFLSSYLHKILLNVCAASVSAPENSDLSKKLSLIRQKIANNVEPRVLIPSAAACYDILIKTKKFDAIGPLLNTLSSNFSAYSDVAKLVTDLSKFFFNALNFRSNTKLIPGEITLEVVEKVESFVIEALVQLVLKLSESSFRPLYYQLCHWSSEHPDRNISFFRLSCRLAESLKGLFVLFAGNFLHNAAQLLDAVNVTKNDKCYFGDSKEGDVKSVLLLENILKTLHLVFLHDSADTSNFLNKDKFEVLLHPLVDQLENHLCGMDSLEERRKKFLTPCLAQMALATDDTLWKSLNYQILLKTKSNWPQVRIGALETIVAMAAKLGEDYLTLLPETIGSLAELLEDEDEKVENAMKRAIQDLEEVLGQPIREYFQQ